MPSLITSRFLGGGTGGGEGGGGGGGIPEVEEKLPLPSKLLTIQGMEMAESPPSLLFYFLKAIQTCFWGLTAKQEK